MGVTELYVTVTSTLLIVCATASFSVNNVPLNCRHIRRELSAWLPMKTDLRLSRKPFHDQHMRICYDGVDTRMKSCCSSRMENKYLLSGNKQIRKLISLRNFQKSLRSKKASLKKEERHFFTGLVHYMMHFLAAKFKISKTSMHKRVDTFFAQLLTNHTRPTASELVSDFIVDISPLLYFHSIKHGSDTFFDMRKRECLAASFRRRTRLLLAPKPGDPLMRLLSRCKRAKQRLQTSIRLLLSALEQLEGLEYTSQCLSAMARNHLCPKCFGTANSSSVCLQTCQNVFHGCHIHWADLESTWSRFMDGLSLLAQKMLDKDKWDLGKPIKRLVERMVKTLDEEVMKELRRLDAKLIGDCFVAGHKIEAVPQRATTSGPTPKFPPYMTGYLESMRDLSKSKVHFFQKLVRKPCQKLPVASCWDGTNLSRLGYRKRVPKFEVRYQEEYNPEVNKRSTEQIRTVARLKRLLEFHRSENDENKLIQEMLEEEGRGQKGLFTKQRRGRGRRGKSRRPRLPEGSGSQPLPEGSGGFGGGAVNKPEDDEEDLGVSGSGSAGDLPSNPTPRKVPSLKPPTNVTQWNIWRSQTTSTTSITYRRGYKPTGKRRVAATDTATVRGAAADASPFFVGVWLLVLLPLATVVSW